MELITLREKLLGSYTLEIDSIAKVLLILLLKVLIIKMWFQEMWYIKIKLTKSHVYGIMK